MKYQATLKIMGREYSSKGDSVVECIQNLKPGFCKSKSVLVIQKGDEKREKVLGALMTSRIFSPSPSISSMGIKQVSLLFDF